MSHAQKSLALLIRDMVVNPMFPKRSRLAGWAGLGAGGWGLGAGLNGLDWTGLN